MPEKLLLEEQRENWGSRAGFVLAAIGSAVGLGNLWGFPYKVHANGGGAFLIPYTLAMLLIGIPLLILEFSLGHMTQRAAPDAFRGINRRSEPVGWWGIILGFVIITYYPVILAWCGSFLVECVKSIFTGGELPWAGKGNEGVKNAVNFFDNTYLQSWTPADAEKGVPAWSFGRLVTPITISLGVMWLSMYLCIFRGLKLVSKVVLWTVPLPWIMLMILTVRGLTLPGAAEGLNFYLHPDWSRLAEPDTWRWAFGQMFFSMSLAFGVMITYASFLHRKSDINNNATIIGLADFGTSFIAGIAIFATVGAMAYATAKAGNPVGVEKVIAGGPDLAFKAFPYALAQLPYSAWFGAVFFIALLTLGIDSAFSITESVLASLVDKTGWSRNKTLVGMTLVGFGCGLVYCTRGGMSWLGAIDDFINSTWGGIALLGLLECVVIGWGYRIGRLREHANERSDWKIGVWWEWLIRYVAPIIISMLFVWSLITKLASSGGFIYTADDKLDVPVLVGLIIAVAAPILSVLLSLVHSPGADRYAQHVEQKHLGRGLGGFGLAMFGISLVLIIYGFRITLLALKYSNADLPCHIAGKFNIPVAWVPMGVALLAAIFAAAVGSLVVHICEKKGKWRPSKLARLSAGLGVMAVGSAMGIMLCMFIDVNKSMFERGKTEYHIEHLSTVSCVVLGVMLAILVVGLAWCFYRAIRAAATEGKVETQEAESMD